MDNRDTHTATHRLALNGIVLTHNTKHTVFERSIVFVPTAAIQQAVKHELHFEFCAVFDEMFRLVAPTSQRCTL